MANIDEIKGRRIKLQNDKGNCYFWVSESDIMMSGHFAPKELAMYELICRLTSKGMKEVLTREVVVEQFRKADSGRCGLLGEMARCIEEYKADQ